MMGWQLCTAGGEGCLETDRAGDGLTQGATSQSKQRERAHSNRAQGGVQTKRCNPKSMHADTVLLTSTRVHTPFTPLAGSVQPLKPSWPHSVWPSSTRSLLWTPSLALFLPTTASNPTPPIHAATSTPSNTQNTTLIP